MAISAHLEPMSRWAAMMALSSSRDHASCRHAWQAAAFKSNLSLSLSLSLDLSLSLSRSQSSGVFLLFEFLFCTIYLAGVLLYGAFCALCGTARDLFDGWV